MYRIFLSPPYVSGTEKIAMEEVIASNWLAPVGPALDTFEQALCAYTGAQHAVALQSGSAALHLSMVLLGVTRGDEVFVSTYTHNATVNCIIYQGATPVFIDSCPETWNLDLDLLADRLAKRASENRLPKAIIAVHLYGNPIDMFRLMSVANLYNIPVIEDAAEALGSTLDGKSLGTFGDLGVLSFNGNKIITTTGGGALLTNSKAHAEKALFLATQARDEAPYFQHSAIGYNYRLSNLLAAFGSAQLANIEDFIVKRKYVFDWYAAFFEKLQKQLAKPLVKSQHVLPAAISNHWLSCFYFENNELAKAVIEALESHKIEARYTWKPMHLQPIFHSFQLVGNGVSDRLFAGGICLPSGFSLSDAQLEEICSVIEKVVKLTLTIN